MSKLTPEETSRLNNYTERTREPTRWFPFLAALYKKYLGDPETTEDIGYYDPNSNHQDFIKQSREEHRRNRTNQD